MYKKAWWLFGLLIAVFTGIAVHLWAVTTGTELQQAGIGQSSRRITVATVRGTIYDTNLQPLVNRTKQYRAAIVPDESLLTLVRPAMERVDYLNLLEQLEGGNPGVAKLTGPVPFADGMCLFLVPERYEEAVPAVHLLGYLDESGLNGVTGLELAYNKVLSDVCGMATASFAVGGSGTLLKGEKPAAENTLNRATAGIVLTLDGEIQKIVEESAAHMQKGAVVVLDPHSGSVVALASFPQYHPTTVAESIQSDDGSLLNRALARYDSGSVFKTVTAAAALENGIPVEQTYSCKGSLTVGETTFHCHHRLGHQTLNMEEAFAYSCNLYFIQLAQQTGASAILDTAECLGLATPIALAEGVRAEAAILPTENELTVPAALANFSFGQGKLLISPLHIAAMTAAVASDGVLPSVYVYKGEVNAEGKLAEVSHRGGERALSAKTAGVLRGMMEKVVESGTGKKAATDGAVSAGKTGTAETGQINGETPVIQSWFTGYFPADNPKYVITVLAEDADFTGNNASQIYCEISNNLIEWEREQAN